MQELAVPEAQSPVRVGCAGWNVPKAYASQFPGEGTHLERYARRFPCAEINSSFYRPHKPSTYARWAASVPEGFLFAVKVPKAITHRGRLKGVESELAAFLDECGALGPKLGPLLVQLPPSLAFNLEAVSSFFTLLRQLFPGNIVCEPRHPTWFAPEANSLISHFEVARVAADPAISAEAAQPGGWNGLVYYRLHGSPRVYYSAYAANFLEDIAKKLAESAARSVPAWCIFDNTAEGAATADALSILEQTDSTWRLEGVRGGAVL